MAGNLVGAWLGAELLRAEQGDWLDQLKERKKLDSLGARLAELAG